MKEFQIIDSYFQPRSFKRKDVQIGIGDDGAVSTVPEGQQLVTTTDTLVENVHFPADASGRSVAHKALAVNLSDLAAMGAEPAWISLSLSLPAYEETWLNDFSACLQELTQYYSIQLIGGDTVQGPLAITITAQGFVPQGQALTRSRAMPGDSIFVTGTVGDAGLGLKLHQQKQTPDSQYMRYLLERFHCPTPRVLVGTTLRRIASACIDVSDGVISDLKHLLYASQCGATIQVEQLPLSEAMQGLSPSEEAIEFALTAGDDYELLFTVPEEQKGNLKVALANCNVSATCIGHVTGVSEKLELKYGDQSYHLASTGFEHFAQ